MKILNIIKKLYPFDYSIAGPGNDKAIKEFLAYFPFKINYYKPNKTVNGWRIPSSFKVIKANLIFNNKIVYDGKASPLGVPINSPSFNGYVNYEDLKEHIYYSNKLKDAIPYNWTGLYRPTKNMWGFCMPKNDFLKLKKGKYKVEIKIQKKRSTMKVLEYTLKGKTSKTIIINAHNCHAYQANDDMSGCAVGIKIFQSLKKIKNRNYTYKLLIAPELTGTVFWLDRQNNKNLKYAILLKSVGNNNKIKLQKSYIGNTQLDRVAIKKIKNKFKKFKIGNFREIYGNDETVLDSPGYNISTISITRFPFKEYHTNLDVPEKLSEIKLQEVESYVLEIIKELESIEKENNKLTVNFKGLVSLSNPKYNLYLDADAPGIDKKSYNQNKRKWNLLMNCLPNDIESHLNMSEISKKYKLPLNEVKLYCNKWIKKGLFKVN